MAKYINSKNFCYLLAALILILHYYIRDHIYNHWENTLGWDTLGYYIYLPFTFIYHDPGLSNHELIEKLVHQYHLSGTFYQATRIANGNWVPMYTIGFSILYAPFFFIAHIWAVLSDYPSDGFSFPYRYCINNGIMIYIVIGIFVMRKVLLQFFTDRETLFAIIFLLLGTNYFHEATSGEGGPHGIIFSAYAIILFLTIKWHRSPTSKLAWWLGFTLGFTVLSRGSEMLAIFIPLFWNVYDKQTLRNKIELIWKNKRQLIIAAFGFIITPLIQIIFWKYTTGSFWFSFYKNYDPFDWDGRHIIEVLFAYKKSWLLYTPMIIFPIAGIVILYRARKEIFWAIFIYFFLNFYLLSSMSAWWEGGGFGMRYFVQSYAVMAIPFGFFIRNVLLLKPFIRGIIIIAMSFFMFLNLFQIWQFNHWIIDGYAMTKAYYWKAFLKTKVSDEDKKLMEIHRTFETEQPFQNQDDYVKHTIAYLNFDSINSVPIESFFLDSNHFVSPPFSCRLTKDHIYSPTFKIPFNIITKKEHAFIRVTLDFYSECEAQDVGAILVITLEHNGGSGRSANGYRGYDLLSQSYKKGGWNQMSVDYLTPYPQSWDDNLVVYVYLRGNKEVNIDNLHIEAFERKW